MNERRVQTTGRTLPPRDKPRAGSDLPETFDCPGIFVGPFMGMRGEEDVEHLPDWLSGEVPKWSP